MIQFFDPSHSTFLVGMQRIAERAQGAQQRLTTGRRINNVADDPAHLPALMEVRASLEHNKQISSNLGRVKTETDSAEGALSNAVSLLDNVATLASEAQPNTQTAASRQQIAEQVAADLQQMVGIANTNVEGRYIFSGDADQTQPYGLDLTQTNPVSAYYGAATTRSVEHPDGSTFAVSRTAQDMFDSADPSTNVFAAVSNLRSALLKNDQAGIDASITAVQQASRYLNTQLAFYGTAQSRVNSAIDFAANLQTQLQTQQSQLEDADLTESITELSQAGIQQQAALAAEKEMPRTSLFDYLG
jgi:flagellar hook-associated protein 3 FlgL